MNSSEMDENMKVVRWVWIGLNIVLVIYAIVLFIYARCFRKSEYVLIKLLIILFRNYLKKDPVVFNQN